MIPLNKPGKLGTRCALQACFPDELKRFEKQYFYTACDGLNYIYRLLYEKHGSLRVAVSPLTCFQALYPIILNGHTPVLVDVDEDTFNLNVNGIDQWPQVDAVEIIYLGGVPVNIAPIIERQLIVIEDCAQAMGGKWQDKWLGVIGDFGVYSILKNIYHPAGLVVSGKHQLDGIASQKVSRWVDWYKWLKTNLESHASYRPSIVNGMYKLLLHIRAQSGDCKNSVRCAQDVDAIEKDLLFLESMNDKRRENAAYIKNRVESDHLEWQQCPRGGLATNNRLLFLSKHRPARDIIIHLRKHGIAANNLTQSYIRPWQEPIWEDGLLKSFYMAEQLPVYNRIVDRIVAVPNSPFLTTKEINHIIQELNRVL